MSIIAPIIIIFLSMLIQVIMQLTPGTFMLFYHYALGKNSKKKTDNLSLSFILGVEFFMAVVWLIVYIFVTTLFCNQVGFYSEISSWIMAGVFIAEGIAALLFYFRRGPATALFVPRKIPASIIAHIPKIKTDSDAFVLGFVSGIPELIFTLPLYIVSVCECLKISNLPSASVIILYIVAATVPLFCIRLMYRSGHNLATIERLRVRFKPYIRLFISLGFFSIAAFIIYLGVAYG